MFTMLANGPKSISFWKVYGKRVARLKEIYQFLKPLRWSLRKIAAFV